MFMDIRMTRCLLKLSLDWLNSTSSWITVQRKKFFIFMHTPLSPLSSLYCLRRLAMLCKWGEDLI
jgi:hypothetical protein